MRTRCSSGDCMVVHVNGAQPDGERRPAPTRGLAARSRTRAWRVGPERSSHDHEHPRSLLAPPGVRRTARRQQAGPHRLGRLEPPAALRPGPVGRVTHHRHGNATDNGPLKGNGNERSSRPETASVDRADGGTARTGVGKADNKRGPRGRCQRLAPDARIPSWPGAPRAPLERPEIRLQSAPFQRRDARPAPGVAYGASAGRGSLFSGAFRVLTRS